MARSSTARSCCAPRTAGARWRASPPTMQRRWRICATWSAHRSVRSATSRWPATARRCGGWNNPFHTGVCPKKIRGFVKEATALSRHSLRDDVFCLLDHRFNRRILELERRIGARIEKKDNDQLAFFRRYGVLFELPHELQF